MATPQIPPGLDLEADRSGTLIRATMVCAVLAGLAVAGRLSSRKMMKASFTLSDLFIVFALICSWVVSGLGVWEGKLGLGKHIFVVPPHHYPTMLKIIFADQILYAIVLTLVKISLLLLYHGLFPGKTFTQLLIGLGVFCIGWGVSCLFVAIFSCIPIHGFWDLMMQPPPRCINNRAFYIGLSVPNILADIAILCCPVTKVWHLQMSRRIKVAVSGMFLLGGIVIICSITRFAFLMTVDNSDFTWSYYTIVVWSAAELSLAVVSACIPTMRPVLQLILKPIPFLTHRKSSKPKGYKSDASSWNNLSDGAPLDDFERLHDYPYDGSRKQSPIPTTYDPDNRAPRPPKDARVRHQSLNNQDSLQQIRVQKDIWIQ